MARIFTCILSLIFIANNSFVAQTLSAYQDSIVRKTIEKQFGEEAAKCDLNLGYGNFCIIEKDTFFNPQGYNYLFQLSNGTLLRLDHSLFHGNNGRSFLFSHNNKIYALGGYGFFTTNNNLTYFNFKSKEWCFEPVIGSSPPFILGLAFKSGENIISFNNMRSGNNAETDTEDHLVYRLNLKTFTWEAFQELKGVPFLKGESYYTKDFVFFLSKNNSLLVSPKTNSIIIINNDKHGISPNAYITDINNNTIVLSSRNNNGEILKVNLSLNDIWKGNEKSANPIELVPVENNSNLKWLFFPLSAIMIFIGLIIVRQRNKKKANLNGEANQDTSNTLIEESPIWDEITKSLVQSSKNVLSTEELDLILNISHLEPDSRKLRRHRIISELQKQNPTLITRIKDSTDRRKFLYKIETAQNNAVENE